MDHLLKTSHANTKKEDLIPLRDHDELSQIQGNPENPDDPVTSDLEWKGSLPPPNPNSDHSRDVPEKRKAHSEDVSKNVLGENLNDIQLGTCKDYCGGRGAAAATRRPEESITQDGRRSLTEILGTGEAWHADLAVGDSTWQHPPSSTARTDVAGTQSNQLLISSQSPPGSPTVSQPSSLYCLSHNVTVTSSYTMMSPRSTAVDMGSRHAGRPQGVASYRDNGKGPHKALVILNIIAAFLSIFCFFCTGVPAFLVALQVHRQKKAGQSQEARQHLWCSFALVIASIFVFTPTLIVFVLKETN